MEAFIIAHSNYLWSSDRMLFKNRCKPFLPHHTHTAFLDHGDNEGHVQVNNIVIPTDCTQLTFALVLLEGTKKLELL